MHLRNASFRKVDGRNHGEWVAANQHHSCGLHGNIRATADCNADIRLGDCRGVVHSVADEGHGRAIGLKLGNDIALPCRCDLGEYLFDAELFGNRVGNSGGISGHHGNTDAAALQFVHGVNRGVAHLVAKLEITFEFALDQHKHDGVAAVVGGGTSVKVGHVDLDLVLSQHRRAADHDGLVVDDCRNTEAALRLELAHRHALQLASFRLGHNRTREHVLRLVLDGCRKHEKFVDAGQRRLMCQVRVGDVALSGG